VRSHTRQQLKAVNAIEVELLTKLWMSEDCMNAVAAFMEQARAKRKANKLSAKL